MRTAARPGLAALGALCVAVAPSSAMADLTMRWDCYLPNAGVDCAVLESSLTSKIPFLRVVRDPAAADVVVTLTSVPAEGGTLFELHFVGKRAGGYTTEVHTGDRIPSSVDSTTATVRLMTKLERGLAQFLDQKLDADVEDGKLTLRVVDPMRGAPYMGRPEQESLKWYVAPTVTTYFSQIQGVGINASGNASIFFNYSEPAWRVQQWIGANYSEQSQPVPGTSETASIHFAGGSVNNLVAWAPARDRRWTLGLLLSAEKNPQANYGMRANGSVGIEFDLVPMQTVNQRNFGFRCAAGPEFERYDATNIQGVDAQAVGRQFCDVFVSWHFALVDVAGYVGETTLLEDINYRSVQGGLWTTWRLTDNFTVSPWVTLKEIHKAINEAQPNSTVYADPRKEIEASMLAAVQQGYTAPFGVQSGLSVRFLFGNGSLSSEDQRWKNTSNLR